MAPGRQVRKVTGVPESPESPDAPKQTAAPRLVVVNRFEVRPGEGERFRADAAAAIAALAQRPGYLGGDVGRNVDAPDLWLLTTTWVNVGSYRRALSAYDVKVAAVPLLSRAVDEPSAYETVRAGVATNDQVPRELG